MVQQGEFKTAHSNALLIGFGSKKMPFA